MQRMKILSTLAFLIAATAAGCNTPTTGAEGNIAFTPLDCGRFGGCDFADRVGVGGLLNVHISGLEGFSTAGLELDSSDPEVMEVLPVGDVGGQPTWSIRGIAPGTAGLLAVDANLEVFDFIDVDIVQPDRLIMQNFIGEAVGPTFDTPGYDEHWLVNANERAVFYVAPSLGEDSPVMGVYEYAPVVDVGLTEMVNDPDVLSEGQLDITPTTPGAYEVVFNDNYGNSIIALIDVQDTL